MAIGDYAIDVNDLTEAQMRFYELRGTKSQYTRLGETSKWFRPAGRVFRGQSYEWQCITNPATPARREKIVTAAGQEFPAPRTFATKMVSVLFADLMMIQASVKFNEIEEMRSKDKKTALFELAAKTVNEAEMDIAEQLNFALHQPRTCEIGTVAAIYDADGSTMTGAAGHAPAFIKVTGNIAQIHRGDILDIVDGGDGSTVNVRVYVWDVVYGPNGPAYDNSGTVARVAGIGPGIIAEPCAADGSTTAGTGYDTTWANVAADDHIARSGEFTTTAASYRNFNSLPAWFDANVDVYRDKDGGALLDRMAVGNGWMQPEVFDYSSGGSPVTFNIFEHFQDAERTLPARVRVGRAKRASMFQGQSVGMDEGITLPESLVAIGSLALLQSTVNDARDSQLFTSAAAMNMDSAKQKELFGSVGFTGMVYHSPTLPPIAIQADPAAQANQLMVLDPQSFFYLLFGSSRAGSVEWLSTNGARFSRVMGGTLGTPTFYLQGGCWTALALECDQVGANWQITGITA